MAAHDADNLADYLVKTSTADWKYITRPERNNIADVLRRLHSQLNTSTAAVHVSNQKLEATLNDLSMSKDEKEKLNKALADQRRETEIATEEIKKAMQDFDTACLAILQLANLDQQRKEDLQRVEEERKKIEEEVQRQASKVLCGMLDSLRLTDHTSPALQRLVNRSLPSALPAPHELSSTEEEEV